MMRKLQRIHFVGIGGIGMSGIAELLARQEFEVTGSDLAASAQTRHLEEQGCRIWIGHSADNIGDAEVVVHSSAVGTENPEVAEAIRRGIPVIRRAEMLAELMRLKEGVAIAGTHGKTTTTSLAGHILTEVGLDPTVIVGGVVRGLGTNARLGESKLLVAEADEYDRSFLKLMPVMAVLTTLEAEHLDTYGTYEELRSAFVHFANSVPFYGKVILCSDEPNLVDLLDDISRPVLTYGLNPQADLRAEMVELGTTATGRLTFGGNELGELQVPLAGLHNLRNALAAVAVALEMDVPMGRIREALKSFSGVRRRFEFRGSGDGVEVYDDYAHHPTEVAATLSAARQALSNRIVAVFQPHLFSRTQHFYREFARELLKADVVVVTDVYPSREKPIEGVTGEMVAEQARRFGHKDVHYVPERPALADDLMALLMPGDAVITLGAGDIYKTSDELLERLGNGEAD
ncbi:UDP-N-acetylmuramate--L-alanine ligase [bacterium]|nr:UDP-N-acetylmuramate--L-alanine ligase [bacterium]